MAASAFPLSAQTVITIDEDPHEQLRALTDPWELPDDLLAGLTRRAEEYERAALTFECRETMRRVKFPRPGKVDERAANEVTYLLTLEDGSLVPVRRRGRSLRGPRKMKAPPAHAWTQLFAAHIQPYMAYRDVGEIPHAFGPARKIQFRGAVPYTDGKDIREWEGVVLVDAFSLLPLEIDARPLNFWPRLRHQHAAYLQSFRFVFFGTVFHFKKKPLGDRVHVRFDKQSNGLTLPVEARVEKVEMVSPDQVITRKRTHVDYDSYRFLDTGELKIYLARK
jgi:hypothetical protein